MKNEDIRYWKIRTYLIEADSLAELSDKLNEFYESQHNKGNVIFPTASFSKEINNKIEVLVHYGLKPVDSGRSDYMTSDPNEKATSKQKYFMINNKIPFNENTTKTEARFLIKEFKEKGG